MFELVWIIQEKYKTAWAHPSATRFEQRRRCADRVWTAATTLSAHGSAAVPARRPTHHFRRPRPPPCAAFKRSAPPRELPFSSSAHCRHHTVVPPLLSHHEMLARSPSELPVTPSSSTSTSGAPPTSAAPPLHHRRYSPTELSHHGQPALALLLPSRPHPKHRAAEYILPNYSDPTSDPYSGLPPSLPHRRSPRP
jgi:hypothetical protein